MRLFGYSEAPGAVSHGRSDGFLMNFKDPLPKGQVLEPVDVGSALCALYCAEDECACVNLHVHSYSVHLLKQACLCFCGC